MPSLTPRAPQGGLGGLDARRIRHLPNPKRNRHVLTSRLPQGILYGMDVAAVARRARTENFPVASVLFPRRLRPHLRAIYGFARLVDILGDEVEGDRLAALDELERELEACYRSEPTWPVMRALAPTIHEFSLPREPFLRLIEANRMDQRISEYATWEDLREYCRHSADPVGRLVLGLLRLDGDVELVAASDDVCTGLQLVNFLQDVPRDLELGRIYLPLEDRRRFDVTELDHPSPELVDLLRFEAARAPRPPGCRAAAAGTDRRPYRPRRRALRARRGGGTRRARVCALGCVHAAAASFPHQARTGGARAMTTEQAYAEVERLTRRRARNFAYGIMVLPREKRRAIAAIYAFARQVDDVADGELPRDEKQVQLERLRAALDSPGPDAMSVALADARARFPIPDSALHALVDGGLQDLDQTRYAHFEELRSYCTKVAGAVGVACVAVYGSDDVERAETLGIALQLINIIRDVREDWDLGRVYLPQDELASFGVTEDEIAAGETTDAWRALMTFQSERARAYLRDGLGLTRTLDGRSALCISTFAGLYRATLDRIEARGFDVFDGPPQLSTLTKLRIVGGGLRR